MQCKVVEIETAVLEAKRAIGISDGEVERALLSLVESDVYPLFAEPFALLNAPRISLNAEFVPTDELPTRFASLKERFTESVFPFSLLPFPTELRSESLSALSLAEQTAVPTPLCRSALLRNMAANCAALLESEESVA